MVSCNCWTREFVHRNERGSSVQAVHTVCERQFSPEFGERHPAVCSVTDSGCMTAVGRIPPFLVALFALAVAVLSVGRSEAESRWVWPLVGDVIQQNLMKLLALQVPCCLLKHLTPLVLADRRMTRISERKK